MGIQRDPLALDWFTRTGGRGGQQRYRWAVKTASDDAARGINAAPIATSIADLIAEPIPGGLQGVSQQPPGPPRQAGVESTIVTLDAWLLRFHPETDGDYHLVLSDNNGNTMIGEIPDPAQVSQDSPFYPQIQSARAAFEAHFPQARTLAPLQGQVGQVALVEINEQVHLTGIGFFDFVHGQDGVAQNGIELHPVIGIEFTAPGQ